MCDDAVAVIANSKENDLRIETVKDTRGLLARARKADVLMTHMIYVVAKAANVATAAK